MVVAKEGKYLTFSLGSENYGIPLETVKEIIAMLPITEVPKTPSFIKGVINLRGKIIPIMDLRLKLSLPEKEYNERTCIIVVDINSSKIKKQMGIAVDVVAEVIDIKQESIQKVKKEDLQIDGEYITGMGKIKEKVIMLLDVEAILNKEELENIINI